jgi:hypothetical protein
MTLKRWIPTFLAFPVGGELAILTVGSLDDPASAAAGGLLAGAVIGGAQWLALRANGFDVRWAMYTTAAFVVGAVLSALATGAGTDLEEVMLAGLITGAAVGAAQSTLLDRGARVAMAWTSVTAASWPIGWLASSAIVDLERGFYVFGASGSIIVTLLTGLALRRLLSTEAEGSVVVAAAAA